VLEPLLLELGVLLAVVVEVIVPLLEDVGVIVADGVFELDDEVLEDTDRVSILLEELVGIELPELVCNWLVVANGELD
jgi:hypothetical protein